ncbi:dihydrolipoamide dehydrogenase [Bellilinea caldifistulae]|uniref:Dihydrolipoyl dehydrogenase n=1 Tax=Bellilinea caldifistulae TaxID=360411 RepID=A0A0N8GMV9_9CHLR|nr:dihydrolipoyl dehydrogenase [Bellilinea caldifistulae]KPL76386.1 dihydrolipoamide dehydrogenase [Bellilinea caldifistulae]GAP12083.1 dihydrolipoamide dehydrogenase [Bellilinea caldifistulae]
MSDYDVIVIGAGPGGYVAAIRAAQLGLKTAVVEKEFLGGVCLNVGCIPSKSLLRNAELAHILRERTAEFGFSFDNLKLDYAVAVDRSRKVSKRLVQGVGFLMKKNKIDVHMGIARLTARDSVQVTDAEGKTQTFTAKNIIIATGAHAAMIPGVKPDGEKVLTYWEAILQTRRPESVVIIGAGAIGVEFATIWNSYGTQVTLVEMLPRIVPLEDEEVSTELAKAFQKRGIQMLTSHKVQSVETTEKGVRVTVSDGSNQKVLEAEQALVAIGFKPNTQDIGLEAAGVELTERGFIKIDERMATNVPGIWAIGDVTGQLLLAHVASAMGIVAAENIAGVPTVKLDYRMMPRATYCQPQVASFGLTEAQAKEQGYEVKIGRFPFQPNGKALGLGDYAGFVKIVTDAKYGEILGAHMIGPEVTELLPELTLAQSMELTVEEIARNVHAHPTLSEVIMEAAHAATGHAIHI